MLLGLEDVQQACGLHGSQPRRDNSGRPGGARTQAPQHRGALPAHLPRIEVVVDIDDKTCPCCKGDLHRMGEEKSVSVWPVAIQTLTRLGIGIIAVQEPAAAPHRPRPGQLAGDSRRQTRSLPTLARCSGDEDTTADRSRSSAPS